MKKLLLTIVAIIVFGSLSAQNVARECVLFEVFTGVNCPYCPAAANGINQMMEEGLAIAPVAVHTSAFSTPDFYTTETNARASFYGISSYPTLKVDGLTGMSGGGGASETLYSYYRNYYNNRVNVTSPFTIDLSYTYTEGYMCQVTAVVNQVGECTASNLRVMIALTESHIQRSWQGMSELNAVTRDFIPTQTGTVFNGPNMTVSETFDMAGYPKENMHLVAWVQSFSTKEVFQAVRISMAPENVAYDVALRGINNVVTKNCSGKVEPTLKVKTFGYETVTSMEIEITDENNNMINTYSWSGSEAQGETFEVNIPEFDIQGANSLNFNIVSINNNPDSYSFDNQKSIAMEEVEIHQGDFYAQIKSAANPEDFYLELRNNDTDEIVEEWHFDQGSHAYKFYITIPTNGCYRLSVISPEGNGCGNGMGNIKDSNNAVVMKFTKSTGFTYKYSVEFECNNAGVEEFDIKQVMVYPNPAKDFINVKGENIASVEVYNALGQIVCSKYGEFENISIETSSLEDGLYVVNVKKSNGETESHRIIVRK